MTVGSPALSAGLAARFLFTFRHPWGTNHRFSPNTPPRRSGASTLCIPRVDRRQTCSARSAQPSTCSPAAPASGAADDLHRRDQGTASNWIGSSRCKPCQLASSASRSVRSGASQATRPYVMSKTENAKLARSARPCVAHAHSPGVVQREGRGLFLGIRLSLGDGGVNLTTRKQPSPGAFETARKDKRRAGVLETAKGGEASQRRTR